MFFHVGTSGFGYKEWKGRFYPESLPARAMLPYYAAHFNSVEVNNTFYRMPNERTIEAWADQVPDDFIFVFKAPRFITHIRKLHDIAGDVRRFLETTSAAGSKAGGLLFQLPPSFRKDTVALESLLDLIPPSIRTAFEFRNATWHDDETFGILRARNAAVCLTDTDEKPPVELEPTASWGYLRLRRAAYSDRDLQEWRTKISSAGWEEAFVFFKHEESASGPEFAKRFMETAEVSHAR